MSVGIGVHDVPAARWGWLPLAAGVAVVDPFTGKLYRHATDDEVRVIGDSTYAVDHYGRPADHTLMITFDDGPDAPIELFWHL
jgi:biofilm PGA synthesis N-glycosyltransferase PgaC